MMVTAAQRPAGVFGTMSPVATVVRVTMPPSASPNVANPGLAGCSA